MGGKNRGRAVICGMSVGGRAGVSMPSHALLHPPSLLGPCHGLDSTHILPQLIPGLSQLGANRQLHKELLNILQNKSRARLREGEPASAYIQVILSCFFSGL